MKKSALITNSGLNKESGGGVVSANLVESLQGCTEVQYILCNQLFPDNKYNGVDAYSVNPVHYGYAQYTPFFQDYMAYHLLPDIPLDLVVTYACPFGLTIEELKARFHCKVVADLAPHNIEISQGEHMKFAGQYPFPHLTNEVMWGLYSRNLRFADAVVVHSHKSAEYLKDKARLSILPHVIPHGCYLPEQIESYPEKFTPGYFGSLGYDKGFSYLVNSWLRMYQDGYLSERHELLIGGKEAPSFRIDGVKDNYRQYFRVQGSVKNLSEFYKQITIYVHPSVTEGFGITVLEAMAHGRPVIVSEGAGVSELVTDGKDGFIVPIRDIDAIVKKLKYFYENPVRIKEMGAEARRTAERYSWEKINSQYIEFFQKLL